MLLVPHLCFTVFSLTLSKLMAVFVPFLFRGPKSAGNMAVRALIALVSSGCHVAETFGRRKLKPPSAGAAPRAAGSLNVLFFFFSLTDKKSWLQNDFQ